MSALHGDGVRDIALTVDDADAAYRETTKRGARGVREPFTLQRRCRAKCAWRRSRPMATRCTPSSRGANYRGTVPARVRRDRRPRIQFPGRPGCKYIDHMVGNVGWNQMNSWVHFYEDVMGFTSVPDLRRQGYFHRIFGADVEGDGERQRAHQISDQRTGRGPQEIADRGIHGFLQRSRRPAHRHGHRKHHRYGDANCAIRASNS